MLNFHDVFEEVTKNKFYDVVSLSIRKCHKIASIHEDLAIICASDKETMHLDRSIKI